jgi:hypothetical protein
VEIASLQTWILPFVVSLVAPLIVLRFWTQEPTQSIAELLHVTESER